MVKIERIKNATYYEPTSSQKIKMSEIMSFNNKVEVVEKKAKKSKRTKVDTPITISLESYKKLIFKAVEDDSDAVKYVEPQLKDDPQFAAILVRKSGYALRYLNDTLKDDIGIVRIAVKESKGAIQFASKRIRNMRDLAIEILERNGEILEYFGDEVRNDEMVVLTALSDDIRAMEHASDDLKGNKDFALKVFCAPSRSIEHFDYSIKADKEVAKLALKSAVGNITHIPDVLKSDKEIMKFACEQNINAFQCANTYIKKDTPFLIECMKAYKALKEEKNDSPLQIDIDCFCKEDAELIRKNLKKVSSRGFLLIMPSEFYLLDDVIKLLESRELEKELQRDLPYTTTVKQKRTKI